MSKIIDPNEPQKIGMELSRETALALASVLGEYSLRITPPDFDAEITEEQKVQALKMLEDRKSFSLAVANSILKEVRK